MHICLQWAEPFTNQVKPGFWHDVKRFRETMEHLWRPYFEEFDRKWNAMHAIVDDPAKYYGLPIGRIRDFISTHREELPLDLVSHLHRTGAKALDALRWHSRVPKSYQWHSRFGNTSAATLLPLWALRLSIVFHLASAS